MASSKKIPWFLTKAGRGFTFFSATTAAIGSFSIHYFPNTMFTDRYRKFYQMYKGAKEVPVEPDMEDLADHVMDRLGLHKNDKKLMHYFTAYGFDATYVGTMYSKWGVQLGIPSNFYCKSTDDLDVPNIRVMGEEVNLSSEAGQRLLESLILSNKAKMFALGAQISEANSIGFYTTSITPGICILSYYAFSQKFNKLLNGYSKPLPFRVILYTLFGSFMAGLYFLIKDSCTHMLEKEADTTISRLGLDLAEGSVEFYSKILQRNKALRELMGSKGESVFTYSGDYNYLIRTPHVPLTHRLDFCKKNLKAVQEDPSLIKTFVAPKEARRLAPIHLDSTPSSLRENSSFFDKK